ncbi:MAG: hypothetical protein M1826_002515 [Phylliscum demangeonii]|nr:MAG: hypothetical protein M1826_002515 [Phylliscum demangeonii]
MRSSLLYGALVCLTAVSSLSLGQAPLTRQISEEEVTSTLRESSLHKRSSGGPSDHGPNGGFSAEDTYNSAIHLATLCIACVEDCEFENRFRRHNCVQECSEKISADRDSYYDCGPVMSKRKASVARYRSAARSRMWHSLRRAVTTFFRFDAAAHPVRDTAKMRSPEMITDTILKLEKAHL